MTRTDWLRGVFPAVVTPFDEDECIDEKALRALIEHLMPHVDGFVINGTTGEFCYLSTDERKRVLEVALDTVGGRKPVIAGTGATSTREAKELQEHARDAGASAALVITPFYLRPTFKELYQHYEELNSVGLPMILYNIPQCTGVHFRWWTAEGLAELSNVIGIKDSSGDMPFMMALLEKVREKVSILCGHDEMGMPALAAGADGLILASANLIPDIWQEIYGAVRKGDLAGAQALQARIQKLVRIVVRAGANQAVKEGLWMMGVPVGNSRGPFSVAGTFRREDREELRLQLEMLDRIPRKKVRYIAGDRSVTTEMYATPFTPDTIDGFALRIGEGFCGPPLHESAHIDLLIGLRDGPVGRAIDEALERERDGTRLRIIYEQPLVLMVPTVTIRTKRMEDIVYTEAAGGVKLALDRLVKDGVLPRALHGELCMIANVFVHPAAANRNRVRFNNFKAMLHATRRALENRPPIGELIRERRSARHPFRYSP